MLLAITRMNQVKNSHSGALALVATLLIWSSYFVTLRSGALSGLSRYDLALLRFLLPAFILLPVLIKSRSNILKIEKRYLLGIMVGAGLPFYIISVIAAGEVQAVIGSLLIPGVAPIFVTLIAITCYRQHLSKRRLLGLVFVSLGVAFLCMVSMTKSSEGILLGIALYLLAAVSWAVYTVSIKVAKLSGLQVAAIINCSAAIVLLILMPFELFESNVLQSSWQLVLPHLFVMGVFCGLVSVLTYAHSVQQLGAEFSACWGALTPVLVAVFAFFILGETIQPATIIAMLLIVSGVVYANWGKQQQ